MVHRHSLLCVLVAAALVSGCGSDGDRTPSASTPCPRPSTEPKNPFDSTQLVGRSVREARGPALRHGCSVRVVERNGHNIVITLEKRPDRIDVVVVDGKIARIDGVY
jgi:hypothetical protein